MNYPNGIKLIVLAAFAWLGISPATSQSPPASSNYGTPEDFKRLYFLNIQYVQSWVRSDTSTYDRLLWANDFVHQNSAEGALIPKKQLMPIFGQPRFDKIEYFYPDNVTIQFITNDVAMIFARTPFKMTGRPGETVGQYNDIYVKRNGAWSCVSANVTSITQPGSAVASFSKVPGFIGLISYLPGSDDDKNILKKLNEKHAEAFMHGKPELAKTIFADDYVLLASNGTLYKKPEVIAQISDSAKQPSVESYSIENLIIRFVAPDVAMIHAAAVMKLKSGTTRAVQYNDIYVNRSGTWLCVSGNDTPIRN